MMSVDAWVAQYCLYIAASHPPACIHEAEKIYQTNPAYVVEWSEGKPTGEITILRGGTSETYTVTPRK